MSITDGLDDRPEVREWTLPEFPTIASKGIREIELDCETDGLSWWERDILIGASVALPDGSTRYLPIRHRIGPNLPEETFRRWAERELRDVHITNTNTRFDVHTLNRYGIDLEAQNCTVSDVAHYAALLDDHRQRSSLEALCLDFLPDERKVLTVFGERLEPLRMASYPAGMVAVRAEADVRQVQKLKKVFLPKLAEQDLMRVKELEDRVIYPVCEMERNGSPINRPLLDSWTTQIAEEIRELRKSIAEMIGNAYQESLFDGGKSSAAFNPDSSKEMEALFKLLGLPLAYTATGRPSFTAAILKRHKTNNVIARVIKLSKLIDLDNKYVKGTRHKVSPDGILRYALHQLRAQKDEFSDSPSEAGTISGRFSSTEITTDVGDNIQQRIKVAKQRVMFGFEEEDESHDDEIYLIRRLHEPEKGWWWLSADAKQIEYRIFAHFANNPRINQAYRDNPHLSFHKYTHKMLKEMVERITHDQWTYRRQKDTNFAKVYGAGLKKIALMLGFVTLEQFEELTNSRARNDHPWLKDANTVDDIYNRELPEVKPLLRRASHLAMETCNDYCKPNDALHRRFPHRGFVKTLLGRRSRFPNNYRSHKAFNSVDQGTSADILKWKIVELHNERKYTQFKMRFVVHDSFDGDIPDIEHAKRVREILDEQTFPVPISIPILWDVSLGNNWAEAGKEENSIGDMPAEREDDFGPKNEWTAALHYENTGRKGGRHK